MQKKGFEMSIELIITVFLAIVTLAIAATLFTGQMDDLMAKFRGYQPPEIEPTADNPISFNSFFMQKGKDAKLIIAFYNNENAPVNATVKPAIACEGISNVTLRTVGIEIPVGKWEKYACIISVPSSTPAGQYPCNMKISKTDKQFVMEVR